MDIAPEIKNLLPEEIAGRLNMLGLPRYRADQIIGWIYDKGVTDFDSMTNLSKALRAQIKEIFTHRILVPKKVWISTDGTRKYLFELPDGACIESVLIPEERRRTLCVSSQVGCALACSFCFTGTMGFTRNLETWEIIEQALAVRRERPIEEWPTNVVLMGMGEPLLNYENVIRAARLMARDIGLKFSHRRITLSTVGIPMMLDRLAHDDAPVSLAISINAPDDQTRSRIMPVNRSYPLDEVIEALERFPLTNRKKITFEYVMLAGINDSPLHARKLANKIKRFPCKVNLIYFNPYPGSEFKASPREAVEEFQKILREMKHLTTIIRKSRGQDIMAACGQLAGDKS